MTTLVRGIKGERGIGACVRDLIQWRVDNVAARNALNFSVQIRRLGASPLRCPDLRTRQAD